MRFRIAFCYHGRDYHEGYMLAPRGCSSSFDAEQWFLVNYCSKGLLYTLACACEVQS
jgi:hypothetical protein